MLQPVLTFFSKFCGIGCKNIYIKSCYIELFHSPQKGGRTHPNLFFLIALHPLFSLDFFYIISIGKSMILVEFVLKNTKSVTLNPSPN